MISCTVPYLNFDVLSACSCSLVILQASMSLCRAQRVLCAALVT
jgi:hypothetical protein